MSLSFVPKGFNRCTRCDRRGHNRRTCTATVDPDGNLLPPKPAQATFGGPAPTIPIDMHTPMDGGGHGS
jgi:hypothetical protein